MKSEIASNAIRESKYFCLIMSDHRVNERVEFGLAFASSTRNSLNVHVRVRVIAAELAGA